jgi:hypothetical protein
VSLLIFDKPQVDFHQILCGLLMFAFAFPILHVDVFGSDFLAPVNGLLVSFCLLNQLMMSRCYEIQHFWVLPFELKQYLESLNRKL